MAVNEMQGRVVPVAIRDLRERIESGKLIPGQMLPGERALCLELGVSRMTLRAALKWLEREGVIDGCHGRRQVSLSCRPGAATVVSNTVAMITQVVDPAQHQRSQDLLAIDTGAIDAVRQAGAHLLLLNPESFSKNTLRQLLAFPPQGVAIGGILADYWRNREWFLELVGKVPVAVNSDDAMWAQCDRLVSDHEAGAYELTNWLLARGHRRILLVLRHRETDNYWVAARCRGYRRALTEAGADVLPPLCVLGDAPAQASAAERFEFNRRLLAGHLPEWLTGSGRVDAIMGVSDTEAVRVAGASRLLGLTPNRDVAIVGYDNYWRENVEREFEPTIPLATMDKHNYETGRQLLQLLQARVAGELPLAPQLQLLKPTMVFSAEVTTAPPDGSKRKTKSA